MRTLRALLVIGLCVLAAPVAPRASGGQVFELKPCQTGRGVPAECGILSVPEDRATGQGRRIGINVMVLRATTPGVKIGLFLLAGGPGSGSTSMSGTATGWMAPLRETMDVVLMDQRGTGGSNPLACETEIAANPARAFGHIRDPEVIRQCRSALQTRADLSQYTTDAAVADMEEIRLKLGYGSIAMYGGSYGTRIAQAYLRRHPDRTRAVVIDGVLPFDVGGPLSYARSLDGSIDRMLANCREQPACQQAHPNLASEFATILKRLDQAPARATVSPASGAAVPVTMTRGDFLYAVRGMLYAANAPSELPPMISQAAASGDLSPFAQRYWSRAISMGRSISYGMHLSVLCPEDVDVLTDAQVAAETKGTRIGSYIVDEYRAACRLWPKATVAADFRTPVTARVPVLLVSGKYDPVTPPEFGVRIVTSLPLGRHIVVDTSGHGSASGCPRAAVLHVLGKGTLDGLPDVCRQGQMPMTRIVSLALGAVMAAAVQVPSALATRLTGPDTGARPLVIRIPMPNQAVFEEQVLDAAHSAMVPIGLERIKEELTGVGERSPSLRSVEVPAVGRPIGELLDVLVSNAPARQKAVPPDGQTFVWRESNRVIHITPFGQRATFLDTVIPSFEIRARSVMAAITAVHQRFDSNRKDYAEWQTRTGLASTDESRNTKTYEILERPISVSLKNATVRDILDAIILANGEVSWTVEYGSSTAEYRGSWISLRTFNGSGRGLGAQIR